MNEYIFTAGDNTNIGGVSKPVPLYHHEQVPFHHSASESSSTSSPPDMTSPPLQFFQQPQLEEDQSSSLFADPWQQQQQNMTNPISCDLQDVLMYYRSQPELLKLILLSKVEEDKRRTEEAKLRAKELDMLLLQQHQLATVATTGSFLAPVQQEAPVAMFNETERSSSSPPPVQMARRDSALGSSFGTNQDEPPPPPLDDYNPFSPDTLSSSSHTTPSSLLQMTSYASPMLTKPDPSPPPQTQEPVVPQQRPPPRRRREMQAITKIVETREYPYLDGYFWKNNGNTVQKKTGNKSIYYKCSNSSKGCPVNKTVTWKENGEYLIKYRGEHLQECGKVQRIVDV
ncbi:hypothetical protein BJV82DRAFT_591760 [Fennellomyces sp. T-0311]|nr:hypothetical protein BJV82DRAFT_591760 [Fennellomyces sp. T-0311]